mmetsp:Transcript_7216/g.6324  ORF Transcript_7216/g.6324 Transcript_7216/m.6324 type:complete len:230 (+) Transcript_7216:3-692(+)
MEEEIFQTKIKISKFWLMLYNCFTIFLCLFILNRFHMEGTEIKGKNVYEIEETRIRSLFVLCEASSFMEFIHHFIGFQKMRKHIFINIFVYNWILFGVIDFYPANSFVVPWIVLRCLSKIIRHFYNAYLAMDLRFEVYWIDYIRMTSYYVFYTVEYLYTLILVQITMPKVKLERPWSFDMPNSLNFNFDYRIIYFLYICVSIPNFIDTFIYLHRKRKEWLDYYVHHKSD